MTTSSDSAKLKAANTKLNTVALRKGVDCKATG